ncbi:DUF2939 domain-containing protein [Croceicoccus sp. YJ47]|uniref:DUF2939 domain-containing protein n=1 Tax=Croceicoccus sp. YJ47 TaxID=2798724 RepID=UPI00192105BF|nr:DUF2939 domain-containing protein [Croceicoccus sp. YJ47]QQN73031.1 DUF2939 domain-containing protein [Croceicoccus sp. YJ47]
MRKLLALLLFAGLLFGGWYYASPRYALHRLEQAARDGDAAALEERVDFAALRGSLVSELDEEIGARGGSPLERLGARIAGVAAGPVVDRLVTPEGVARLLREGRAGPVVIRPERGDDGREAETPDLRILRRGLDEFRVTGAATQGAPALIFARDGLGWTLVGVDL